MRDSGVDFDAWRDARGETAAIKTCGLTNLADARPVLHFLTGCRVSWDAHLAVEAGYGGDVLAAIAEVRYDVGITRRRGGRP